MSYGESYKKGISCSVYPFIRTLAPRHRHQVHQNMC